MNKKLAMVVGIILFAAGLWGQQVMAPKYTPTEIQSLRLQVKQRDAQIAQIARQQAEQNFQSKFNELNSEGEKVREENKWPKTVQFDPSTITFNEPPVTVVQPAKP